MSDTSNVFTAFLVPQSPSNSNVFQTTIYTQAPIRIRYYSLANELVTENVYDPSWSQTGNRSPQGYQPVTVTFPVGVTFPATFNVIIDILGQTIINDQILFNGGDVFKINFYDNEFVANRPMFHRKIYGRLNGVLQLVDSEGINDDFLAREDFEILNEEQGN